MALLRGSIDFDQRFDRSSRIAESRPTRSRLRPWDSYSKDLEQVINSQFLINNNQYLAIRSVLQRQKVYLMLKPECRNPNAEIWIHTLEYRNTNTGLHFSISKLQYCPRRQKPECRTGRLSLGECDKSYECDICYKWHESWIRRQGQMWRRSEKLRMGQMWQRWQMTQTAKI